MFPLSCGVDIGYRALLQRDSAASAGPATLRERASTDVPSRASTGVYVDDIVVKTPRADDLVATLSATFVNLKKSTPN